MSKFVYRARWRVSWSEWQYTDWVPYEGDETSLEEVASVVGSDTIMEGDRGLAGQLAHDHSGFVWIEEVREVRGDE